MRIRTIYRETFVKAKKEEVFNYFAKPENLLEVTPPNIPVQITNSEDIEMKEGAIINLKMKLFKFFPVNWQTKIEEWNPPNHFVDTQPNGPYKYWKHIHTFKEEKNGTVIIDHVEYAVPGWFLEPIIHILVVKNNLINLFDYRQKAYVRVFQ